MHNADWTDFIILTSVGVGLYVTEPKAWQLAQQTAAENLRFSIEEARRWLLDLKMDPQSTIPTATECDGSYNLATWAMDNGLLL